MELDLYGPVMKSGRSRIFFGEGSRYPVPVAVKLCLDRRGGPSAADLAQSCFVAMRRLHAVTEADSILASPRPLDVFPEIGVVIFEWVPGRSLHELIGSAAPGKELALVRTAGIWLGRLASLTRDCVQPLPVAAMLSQVDQPDMPDAARRAVALLQEIAPLLEGQPVT